LYEARDGTTPGSQNAVIKHTTTVALVKITATVTKSSYPCPRTASGPNVKYILKLYKATISRMVRNALYHCGPPIMRPLQKKVCLPDQPR
jgi:hypothetical protein